MKKFEYCCNYFEELIVPLEVYLNRFGQDGWELVTVNPGVCIFKRELIEPILHSKYDFSEGKHTDKDINIISDPRAHTLASLITPRQLIAIRVLGKSISNLDYEEECVKVFNCKLEELNKDAARVFIEHLNGMITK